MYWLAAVALVAAILASLDYSPAQAVLVGLIFCPCALALEYLMPKARRPIDKVYLSLAVLVSVILLVLILHFSVWVTLNGEGEIPCPWQAELWLQADGETRQRLSACLEGELGIPRERQIWHDAASGAD